MAKLFADLPLDALNGEIEDAFNQIDSDGGGSLDMSVRSFISFPLQMPPFSVCCKGVMHA